MGGIHLLRGEGHRRMAWKNGGGETLEIAIAPPGATTDDFDWRVSMAAVAADGPFSRFAGVDRTLTLLEGGDMMLAVAGRSPVTLRAGDSLAFPADIATMATLAAGAITDLNVMTRRGRYAHRVEPLIEPRDVTVAAGAVLLLFGDGLAIETESGALGLGHRDCARIDGPAEVHVGPAHGSPSLSIRIWPLARS